MSLEVLIATIAVVITVLAIVVSLRAMRRATATIRNGLPATATIEGISDTGITISTPSVGADAPVYQIDLLVTPPGGGTAYRAHARQAVPRICVPFVVPGARVAVLVDPSRAENVKVSLKQLASRTSIVTSGSPEDVPSLEAAVRQAMAMADSAAEDAVTVATAAMIAQPDIGGAGAGGIGGAGAGGPGAGGPGAGGTGAGGTGAGGTHARRTTIISTTKYVNGIRVSGNTQVVGDGTQPATGDMAFTGAPAHIARAADLLSSGTRAAAVITVAMPIGKVAGELDPTIDARLAADPVWLFTVRVEPASGEPFTAVFGQRVPEDKAGRIGPGTRLSVAVDPANPTREVAIDWDASPVEIGV